MIRLVSIHLPIYRAHTHVRSNLIFRCYLTRHRIIEFLLGQLAPLGLRWCYKVACFVGCDWVLQVHA